jgi:hypothetical protein
MPHGAELANVAKLQETNQLLKELT